MARPQGSPFSQMRRKGLALHVLVRTHLVSIVVDEPRHNKRLTYQSAI